MTQALPKSTGPWPSNPRVVASGAVVLVVLLSGFVALAVAENYAKVILVKPPAPLSKPLPELAQIIGPYVMEGEDKRLPEEEVATLGTEDYLLRCYHDTRKKPGDLGEYVSLNLNYYASGSATPHVPEVCWAGNGLRQSGNAFVTIENVPHMYGPASTLRMRRVSFEALRQVNDVMPGASTDTDPELINVAYVFQVNGGYVSGKDEVAKRFWDPKAKYAYHTKIEMTLTRENGRPVTADPKDAEPLFAEFLRTTLPAIEECLPDARKLSAEGAGSMPPATAPAATPMEITR